MSFDRNQNPTKSSTSTPIFAAGSPTNRGVPAGAEPTEGRRLVNIREIVDGPARQRQQNKAKADPKAAKNAAEKAAQRRRDRFADQRTARAIWRHFNPDYHAAKAAKVPGRGVTACNWHLVQRPDEMPRAQVMRAETPDGPRAFMRGLSRCDLRWVCPCCTRARSEESRDKVNQALAVARDEGWCPVFLTLTARHHRRLALAVYWDKLNKAEKALKTSNAWKALNADDLPGGFAKATEITHGANGWHPHFHLILLVRAGSEDEAIERIEVLRAEWLHQLDRVGLDGKSLAAQKKSFDVQGAAEAGEYLTKWGAAEEMTLAAEKVGRAKGRSPWQLLRDARTAPTDAERKRAAALWWEFVQVFKNVHQLRASPKFNDAAGRFEPPEGGDEEEAAEPEAVATLDEVSWSRGRWRQVRLVEAAERGDRDGARDRVLAALLDDRTDADDSADDEPGPLIE